MGLEPLVFWSLTVREFWIKYRAFIRAEDRAESAWLRHALRTQRYKKADRNQIARAANALKRYPVKRWLQP
jgi:hypothetical protein